MRLSVAAIACVAIIAGAGVRVAGADDGVRVHPPPPIPEAAFFDGARTSDISATDLAALRYYKRTGQTAKFQAEVARLQRIKPGWSPPDNLEVEGSQPSVQHVWDLLGSGRYAAAYAEVASMRRAHPGWTPPENLERTLHLAQQRLRLVNASRSGQTETVLRIASRNPELLACDSIDAMWRTAEARAALGRPAEARQLYARSFQQCTDPADQVATLQKAHARLSHDQTRRLLDSLGTEDVDDSVDGAIARIRGYLANGRLSTAVEQGTDLPGPVLANYSRMAKARQNAQLAANLGWYRLKRGKNADALRWFDFAASWGEAGSVRLGRALAHNRLGQADAAEAVAGRGLSDPTLRDVFVGLATTRLSARDTIAPQRLERYADIAQRYDDARLAVALGWQHYDNQRYDVSARWFANALDWEATPKAFEGHVLALSAAGRREDARDVHRRWREQFPDVAERLEIGRAESPLAEAQRTGDYRTCLETARRLRARGDYEPGDAVLHGWCLMDLNRHAEAELQFEAAITDLRRSRPRNEPLLSDALVGRATAQIAQGRIADALRGLDRQALSSQQIARLRAQALAEYAYTAMERQRYAEVLRVLQIRERYATPTRGLRVIEGWAHYNTGRSERAARIFEELDVQFSTEDTRDALELVRKYTR